MNVELASRLLEKLFQLGVREVCLCAGARNAPILRALQSCPAIRSWHFFEERSAAFYALGRSWATGRRPVAIVTTSGTAAGELMPAMMEAHYAGVPLIAVTADRPRSYRGTGAPQSAEQVGLFSHYVRCSYDITTVTDLDRVEGCNIAPLHINVCFAEPLLDGDPAFSPHAGKPTVEIATDSTPSALEESLAVMRRPLLILSQLPEESEVGKLLDHANCLIYAEATSQLRASRRYLLRGGADTAAAFAAEGFIDGVIRIGNVPTLRFWRDLEERFVHLPVVSLSRLPFTGLARNSVIFTDTEEHRAVLHQYLQACDCSRLGEAMEKDARNTSKLERLLARYPNSEPGRIRWLSDNLPSPAKLFLGNSLPIREWDLAANYDPVRSRQVHASRGLNGIDGQVSAFLGWSDPSSPNVGIFGDLTALYDLSAPWILKQRPELHLQIVVINNHGGQIFERMFADPWFINSHQLDFKHWAGLWDLEYAQNEAMLESRATRLVAEIKPDPEATKNFWREYSL